MLVKRIFSALIVLAFAMGSVAQSMPAPVSAMVPCGMTMDDTIDAKAPPCRQTADMPGCVPLLGCSIASISLPGEPVALRQPLLRNATWEAAVLALHLGWALKPELSPPIS